MSKEFSMCSRFFTMSCIARLYSRCKTYGGDKRAKTFEVRKTFVKRNFWAQYFVEDLMAEEHHGTLESLCHPFNAKKYYSLLIWRIDNMTITDESAGMKAFTDIRGNVL
ncbi:hypothetical protein MKW98_012090 [Papaver atlanticum]|uniref:Uncharacterized protein n=1 Tax=Papaver atlanticum TaxID=357466 RepID=A0AAD4THS6_9MAGN|nr:hypothetical protein MKW98_012090 [Papaver atlanticum]